MTDDPRFRAVVVDDEPAGREVVLTFLAADPRVEVVGEAANGKAAVEVVRRTTPDLLFLDIQMPDLDGFGVLEALGDDVPRGVVFVTAHDEHALRAFEVHALDYLLKPFGKPRFTAAVDRALDRLGAQDALSGQRTLRTLVQGMRVDGAAAGELTGEEAGAGGRASASASARASSSARAPAARPTRLGVRQGTRTVLVEVSEIDWIEADGDYVRLHVGEKIHLVTERMHALEDLLDPARFFRIHRSAIANLARVRELRREPDGGGSILLDSDVQLRVSRTRWEGLEEALGIGDHR